MKWRVLPPMPKPNSHIECAWVMVNNSIIITGGTTEKHPVTKRMMLVGEIFQFHLDSLVKTHLVYSLLLDTYDIDTMFLMSSLFFSFGSYAFVTLPNPTRPQLQMIIVSMLKMNIKCEEVQVLR